MGCTHIHFYICRYVEPTGANLCGVIWGAWATHALAACSYAWGAWPPMKGFVDHVFLMIVEHVFWCCFTMFLTMFDDDFSYMFDIKTLILTMWIFPIKLNWFWHTQLRCFWIGILTRGVSFIGDTPPWGSVMISYNRLITYRYGLYAYTLIHM
jgi:hypothetical protein